MRDAEDFWSRRRRAVAKAEAEEATRAEREAAEQAAREVEAQDDESLLKMLGLPDPETLSPRDAAAFMAREVPKRLRKRAMRALFSRHPGLSVPDGLQDYDDDYTDAGLSKRPEKAVWTAVTRSVEDTEPPAPAPVPTAAVGDEPIPDESGLREEMPMEDEGAPSVPKRMVFRFEEDTV